MNLATRPDIVAEFKKRKNSEALMTYIALVAWIDSFKKSNALSCLSGKSVVGCSRRLDDGILFFARSHRPNLVACFSFTRSLESVKHIPLDNATVYLPHSISEAIDRLHQLIQRHKFLDELEQLHEAERNTELQAQ